MDSIVFIKMQRNANDKRQSTVHATDLYMIKKVQRILKNKEIESAKLLEHWLLDAKVKGSNSAL